MPAVLPQRQRLPTPHEYKAMVSPDSGGPNTNVATLKTITLVGNIPPAGSATLTNANLRGADKLTHRGMTMSSGVSLP